jgi:hypothetical protein
MSAGLRQVLAIVVIGGLRARGDVVPTVFQQRNVPEAIRSHSTLTSPDYVDLFTITTDRALRRSPEQWARAGIEDAAGLAGQFVWRALCGLRLERRTSPDYVGGWKIADRGDSWIRLEAASWFMTAHIVFQVDDGQLSVATFIRYDRPTAALIWPPLSAVHRLAMPGLLRHTVRAMRLGHEGRHVPNSAHAAHPWVIAQIAPDFTLLDVWALPVRGGPGDRDSALELLSSFDPANAECAASRALFSLRFRLGAWFGWDDPAQKRPIPGCTETTLSARLPDELRGSANGSVMSAAARRAAGGFTPLYRTDDEWAAEISNATVHGVLHLAWVEQRDGRYRAQMSVYVKPRGKLGEIYLTLIQPFRHLIVYPALMRQLGRAWDARHVATPSIARDPQRT